MTESIYMVAWGWEMLGGGDSKGAWGMIDTSTFLIVVMVSQVYTPAKTYKIEHFNQIVYCMSITTQLTR